MDKDTFPELERYMGYMQAIRGRSPLTMKEYRYDLTLFFRFLKRQRGLVAADADLKDISLGDIDAVFLQSVNLNDMYAFITYMGTSRNASAANRSRKIASLRSFFHYLKIKRGIIAEDPTVELESPKQSRRLPKYLTLEESKKLLGSAAEKQKPYSSRDYCILTLFLNCGMRLSELVHINLKDIREDTLTVFGKGAKERTIYLNSACIAALETWLADRARLGNRRDPDALFLSRLGTRISTKQVEVIVKNYLRDSGIDSKRYSVHKLRHTAATLMYKYGKVDIRSLQQILGHESISTTEIYTHVDNEQLHRAVESNPLANIKK